MDRDQKAQRQERSAANINDYDALRFAGIRLINAIARLVRAGKEHR